MAKKTVTTHPNNIGNIVLFEGLEYSCLLTWLNENWGRTVVFDNGCSVCLQNDNNIIWRTDPYGQDSGCNYVDGWENNIREWVKYWNEPRTETGNLILD